MDQLREQGQRIEKLSRIEHDLIKEVHPQVSEIKQGMDEMIAVVKESSENNPPAPKRKGWATGFVLRRRISSLSSALVPLINTLL